LLQENVAFTQDNSTDPPRYIANLRVVAPNIPCDRAVPPEYVKRRASPRRPQEALMRSINKVMRLGFFCNKILEGDASQRLGGMHVYVV